MNSRQNNKPKLSQNEAIVLEKIERELDCTLEHLEIFELDKQGYQVHESHIVHLNFNNFDLNTIPQLTGELSHIKTLDFRNNSIKTIDFNIFNNCKNLGSFYLENNQITQVDFSPLTTNNSIRYIDLSHNQIESIDLSPLEHCSKLSSLTLNDNQLNGIDLSFLDFMSPLHTLTLYNNSIEQLDISPLLSLTSFNLLHIDKNVHLTATPIHRDYTHKYDWFLYKHLPNLEWLESSIDPQIQSLFEQYNTIMKNFRHDEFWADFRDRRLSLSPEDKTDVVFFDFMVVLYLKNKNKELTVETYEEKDLRRMNIEQEVQGQFLSTLSFLPLLKTYFEVSQETTVAVDVFNDDIVIFHYWLGSGPTQLPRAQTISWIQIHADMDQKIYYISKGFNRGFIHQQSHFHPVTPPTDFPSDIFESTEVRDTPHVLTVSDPCEVISTAKSWLKLSHYASFDPEGSSFHYRSGAVFPSF